MSSHDDHYEPTRTCPHPWCPRLHWAVIGIGLVTFTQILFTGIASLLFLAAMMVIAFGIARLQAGKSLVQEAMDEQVEQALGVRLVVRRGWALAAVGCDGFFVLNLAATTGVLFAHPHTSTVPTASTASYIAIGISLGTVAFNQFAHRQATRPAKPKRVTMPAAADVA